MLPSPAVAESGPGTRRASAAEQGARGSGGRPRRRAQREPLHVEGRKLCVPARRPRLAGPHCRAGKGSSAAAPGARSQPASPRTPPLPSAARRAAVRVRGGRIRPGAAGPDSHPRPRASALPPGLGAAPADPSPPRSDAAGQDVPRRPAACGHVSARPGRAEERSQGPALARAPSRPRRLQPRGPTPVPASAPRGARPLPPAPAAGSELAHQVRRAARSGTPAPAGAFRKVDLKCIQE